MPNRAAHPAPIHSCSRPESRETLASMTRLMRQASHSTDGCGSLTSSSDVMSPNVRCSDSWTRVNASSRILFAIMRVSSRYGAWYQAFVSHDCSCLANGLFYLGYHLLSLSRCRLQRT